MKRKFKKGDRVLVRNTDLNEWVEATFMELDQTALTRPFIVRLREKNGAYYSQCRHIDDFRTGDKVQVSDDGRDWEDAIYLARFMDDGILQHMVETDTDNLVEYKYCRWHPSMPWAEKEEIIDEPYWVKTIFQRLDAIERKLYEK